MEISLWRESQGGAITVSTYKRKESATTGAREHVKQFAESLGGKTESVEGDGERASANLVEWDGTRWLLRVHIFGEYLVVATFNGSDSMEAVPILDSIQERE